MLARGVDCLLLQGGVWWSWKVPFDNSVRVTIERSTRLVAHDVRYLMIRGVRDYVQFAVGDAILAASQRPRLKVQRTDVTLQPYAFASIFSSRATGMILLVLKRVISANKRFTEGCIRVFEGDLTKESERYDWLLSTGVEDYCEDCCFVNSAADCLSCLVLPPLLVLLNFNAWNS